MEERFELFGKNCIKDNRPDARCQLLDAYKACVILNEQDKRIKELEQENLSLQEQSIRDNQNWIEETTQLKQQLANSIRPKFNRQEHIYCVAFGEIREFVVVAYLDNNITLCEDTTTGRLEWCDNNFLVLTKEEAEAKLKEIKRGKDD